MPIILVLGRQRQEDHTLEASLNYTVRPCFWKKKKKKKERRKEEGRKEGRKKNFKCL
jgi:hypothetical protein